MDQIRKLLNSLTARQQISLLVAAVVVGAAFYGISHWSQERDFRPLYTSMTPEDAGQVVSRLRDSMVDYRLTDGGATVLVPSAQVAEMRLQLAAAGLPQSGRLGFELFDQTNFGTTDFAEQVNYHRALEGELERSVMALSEVERARVHITLAKDSVFLESRSPAKASVMVQLRTGRKLAPENVQAITYLVSSAVENLEPQAVSVLDMRGNLLSRPRSHGGMDTGEPSDALLDYRKSIEKDLLAKIGSTLEPLLGADRFRAGVSIECDFTSGEQSEEIFDPERSVMATSQRTEDVAGTYNPAGGVPGTASTLPRPVARSAKGSDGHSRRTENVAYQTSRTVRRTHMPQGDVKRISVSLLLDHEVHWEGTGEDARRTVAVPSEEKIRAIRELVSGVVGLNADRGDQLIVETLPFESTRNWQPAAPLAPATPDSTIPLPAWLQNLIPNQKMLAIVGAGAVLGLLLVLAAAILIFKRRRSGRGVKSVTSKKRLSAARQAADETDQETDRVESKMQEKLAEQAALKARLEEEAIKSLQLGAVKTKKAEVLTKHISEQAEADPMAMAQLMRTWLNEERD